MSSKQWLHVHKTVQGLFICLTFFAIGNRTLANSNSQDQTFLPLVEFIKLESEHQKRAKSIFEASFSADFPNMNCTGTFISNEGHFLTADHCIQSCFKFGDNDFEKYVEYEAIRGPNLEFGQQQWLSLRSFKNEVVTDKILCELEVNGEKKKARLIAAGKGAVQPFSPLYLKELLPKYKEYESKGIGWPSSDFAVLQLIEKPQTPCLHMGNRWPQKGEVLRAVSYTCIPAGQNLKGDIPFYTEGVLATPDMFKSADGKNEFQPGHTLRSFASNIDADECSSGSAVIGSDGKILGVMSMVKDPNEKWGPTVKLLSVSSSTVIVQTLQEKSIQDIVCEQ